RVPRTRAVAVAVGARRRSAALARLLTRQSRVGEARRKGQEANPGTPCEPGNSLSSPAACSLLPSPARLRRAPRESPRSPYFLERADQLRGGRGVVFVRGRAAQHRARSRRTAARRAAQPRNVPAPDRAALSVRHLVRAADG